MIEIEATAKPKEPRVYEIPEVNYAVFNERISRLQRRAAKLGSAQIVVTELRHEDHLGYLVKDAHSEPRLFYVKPGTDTAEKWPGKIVTPDASYKRFYFVTVDGARPKLNGWSFLGTLEVIRDEDGGVLGNMVRNVPGCELPEEYRQTAPHCDHCQVQRNWKETFVVRHDDGTTKQVGRNCLRDFLGHADPDQIAAFAEILITLGEMCECAEDEEWEMGGGAGWMPRRFNIEAILERVAAIIRMDGWKPRVYEHKSTASTLRAWLYPIDKQDREAMARRFAITNADQITARETLAWMQSLGEDGGRISDYESNLNLLSRAGAVEDKALGFVASAVSAYLRAHDQVLRTEKERTVSQYLGAEKERLEMVLTLQLARYSDGMYGTTTFCKFHDERGNVIVWWASGSIDMAQGTIIKAKATIKEHKEYEGVKQTYVSRLKVVELISTPAAAGKEEDQTAAAESKEVAAAA